MSEQATATGAPPSLRVLTGVLVIESLVMIGVVGLLVFEQFASRPTFLASSLALLGSAAAAAVFMVALTRGAFLRRRWIRGASIAWHAMQIAAASVVVQGDMAPWAGWALIALAAIGIVCTVHPATYRALRSPDDEPADGTGAGS